MSIITDLEQLAKPIAIYAYFDKIQFWRCEPLDHPSLSSLERNCGSGGLYVEAKPAGFNSKYRQRVELRQPSPEALASLAKENGDVLINRIELAIDWSFASCIDRDETFEFFHRRLVRRHHGKKQEIWLFSPTGQNRPDDIAHAETRYDAGRWAPNLLACYREDHSRMTGELNVLHTEWRANGVAAVRRVGINSALDLLDFDHRQFWARRLLLLRASPGRLGRLFSNQFTGKKRRAETYIDRRHGTVLIKSSVTTQQLIDRWRSKFRVHRALTQIPNDSWLPEPTTYTSVIYPKELPTRITR
jgi:hypothetical protein